MVVCSAIGPPPPFFSWLSQYSLTVFDAIRATALLILLRSTVIEEVDSLNE